MIDIQPQSYPVPYRKPSSFSSHNGSTRVFAPTDNIFCSQESSPYPFTASKGTKEIPSSSHTKPMSIIGQYCYIFFYCHLHNPYPSLQEKQAIVDEASCPQVTLTTISNWFTNSRRRSGWIDICNEYYKGDTKAMVEVCTHVLVNGGAKRKHDPQGIVENILSMRTKVKAWDEEQTKTRDWVVDLASLLHEITLEEEGKFRSASQALYANTSDSSPLPWTDVPDRESKASSQATAIHESGKKRGREEDHTWETNARGRYRCVSLTSTISTSSSEGPSEPESIFFLPPPVLKDDGHPAGIKRHRAINAFENELDHTYAFESPETNILGLWDFPFTFATSFDSSITPSPKISERWTESAPSNYAFSESNKRSRSRFETDDFIPSKKSKLNHCLQATTLGANTPLSINTESERSCPTLSGQEMPLFQAEKAYQNTHKVDISPLDESWELDVNMFDWASFMSGLSGDGSSETSDNTHREEELDLSLTFLQEMVSPELNEQELHLNGNPHVSADPEVGSLLSFDQEYVQGISDNYVHCGSDGRQSECRSQESKDNSVNIARDENTLPSNDFLNQTPLYGSEFSSDLESFEQAAEELRNLLSEWSSTNLINSPENSSIGIFDSEIRS